MADGYRSIPTMSIDPVLMADCKASLRNCRDSLDYTHDALIEVLWAQAAKCATCAKGLSDNPWRLVGGARALCDKCVKKGLT
jgi:hypothetical protein